MQVKFTARARADLQRLSVKVCDRILEKLDWIANNPKARIEMLSGLPKHLEGLLKYRIGEYRFLFWLDDDELTVYRIGHRSTIYKDI